MTRVKLFSDVNKTRLCLNTTRTLNSHLLSVRNWENVRDPFSPLLHLYIFYLFSPALSSNKVINIVWVSRIYFLLHGRLPEIITGKYSETP